MCAITGRELSAIEYGPSFRERYGYPFIALHRADLLNIILEACKKTGLVTLLTDHRVESIEDVGECIQVRCENGNTYQAEIVIGADGVKSKTRDLIVQDKPVFSGDVAYRGTIPTEEITKYVDVKIDEKLTWIGPHIHLVQYSLRNEELFNQVANFRSFQYREGLEDSTDWGTPEELDERYSICCESVRKAITFMSREIRWPMYDRAPIERWTKGRLALLGDAAHAMVPYLAQGAVQTLEDVDSLVEKFRVYGDDYQTAFAAYEKDRVPRATKVQRDARTMGKIKHTNDPLAIMLRDYILTERSATDYKITDWLYSPQDYKVYANDI